MNRPNEESQVRAGKPSDCPPDESLAALASGTLAAEEVARLDEHVDACAACRELLAAYARECLISHEGFASTVPDADRVSELLRAAGFSPGTRLGRYVILERVGAGASGVVYAAHDPDLDRKIAIKVLHRGIAEQDGRERLLKEARAMAKLAHPNVVAVHDVGSVGEHVFVAMEFVAGGTLRSWMADVHTTDEIVRAFTDAGRGLAAAHKAGLIHRDFKPENVLVGKDGRVRVTDFGLAARGRPSELAPDSEGNVAPGSDASLWTKAMAGTPAYMAPEQRDGRPADARSDQYAFCVAFGEALHGSRPSAPRDVHSPKGSTRRVPSRVSAILARGLEPDPARRFLSMTSLLRALEAAQSRGRRWLAFFATLAVLAIGGGATARAVSARARLCADASSDLRGVWDDGTRDAASRAFAASGAPNADETWQRVSRSLDGYTASWVASRTDACQATRIRGEQSDAMLGLRMQCLDRRRGELEALAGVFAHADGEVVQHAVDAAGRLAPISDCDDTTALASTLLVPDSKETRERVERVRADLDRVVALESAGKFADALPAAREDAARARTIGYRPAEAEALFAVGRLENETGDPRAAVATLNQAVDAAEAGRDDEVAAEAWVALVALLGVDLDRGKDAEPAIRRANAAVERAGPTSPAAAMLHEALGGVDQAGGRYHDAVRELRAAIDLEKKSLGPRHLRVGRSLRELASMLRDDGDTDAALDAYAESLAIEKEALGPMHPELAATTQSLGVLLSRLGRYGEARADYERALSIRERVLGASHPLVGETLASLVVAMRWSGAAAEALPLAERAERIEEAAFGLDNQSTASAINNIGYVQEALGHLADARASYERGLAIQEKVFGPDGGRVSLSLANLGRVRLAQGDAAAALALYERAARIDEKTLKPDHPDRAYALVGVGRALLAAGQPARARAPLEKALALRESGRVAPRLLAEARFAVAHALVATGDRPRAVALAEQARTDYAPLGPAFDTERSAVDAWLRENAH
ncbi:MAG TPA: serine/threonine-protein kinase [Polyangiaceae bacterium]|jgi:tetratricopeptide (TPR) repeat protein/tRNA A-37 threonylcarbamoyl transferase component Bud32